MKGKKAGRVAVMLLAAAFVFGGALAAVSQLFPRAATPTLEVHGMEFKVAADGSIQALVTVALQNVPKSDGAAALLKYNSDYLAPSDAKTNALLPAGATQAFFTVDEKLLLEKNNQKISPFSTAAASANIQWGFVSTSNQMLSVSLLMDQTLAQDPAVTLPAEALLKKQDLSGNNRPEDMRYYFEAGTTQVPLGTLSFRVVPEKLSEMVASYSKFDGAKLPLLGIKTPQSPATATGWGPNDWQINYLYDTGRGGWAIASYTKQNPSGPDSTGPAAAGIDFAFPRTLVKAGLVVGDVSVNAYQAFTDGSAADLAALLQRYAPTVEEGYANGDFEHKLLKWGVTADEYKVEKNTGTAQAPAWTLIDGTNATYDPLGGQYRVTQSYYYQNAQNRRTKFPLPMVAQVTITPVKLDGISAQGLEKTYQAGATSGSLVPPTTYRGLHLPVEAVLAVSPVPGTVSLTAPVSAWTPADTGTPLSAQLKTKDPSPLPWPAVGNYDFTAAVPPNVVRAAYPWLTVPQTDLPLVAKRTIVPAATDATAYTLTATTLSDGTLRIRVERVDKVTMAAGSTFRVQMPNGAELDKTWFAPEVSDVRSFAWVPDGIGYTITINAQEDATATAAYAPQRDSLRRSINLGGSFAVAIQEGSGAGSDFIPVYADPRANHYRKNYTLDSPNSDDLGVFDFTGARAGIFPFYPPTKLGRTVVLPTGYSVATTYDGASGAEPGALSTLRAEADWTLAASKPDATAETITPYPAGTRVTHGAQVFAASAFFDGYGQVQNDPNQSKQVRLKTQVQPAPTPALQETLTLTGPNIPGITQSGGEVSKLVYNPRQKGYQSRQEFTLTLTNTGTKDIYGLYLDLMHAPTPAGTNHFEIIKHPAAYLPAGAATKFTVTYRYNLSAPVQSAADYKDKIAVRSNSGTLLKTFDAEFQVADGVVSTVKVQVNNDQMGSAKLIAGLPKAEPVYSSTWTTDAPIKGDKKPDLTDGLANYMQDYKWVWLAATPDDEYAVKAVYYHQDNSAALAKLPLYTYYYEDAATHEITTAYFLQMPDYDITVYVDFYEPMSSKLRLSALRVYAAEAAANTPTIAAAANLQILRRGDDTAQIVEGSNLQKTPPDHRSVNDFTVVLPTLTDGGGQSAQAQVSISLRQLLAGLSDTENIAPTVRMGWYQPDGTIGGWIYSDTAGKEGLGNTAIAPALPSEHLSLVFPAPPVGSYCNVKIELKYVKSLEPYTRTYSVKLVRPGEQVFTMGFGNAPYGMIRNDSTITDWRGAEAAFAQSWRFSGDANTPQKAKATLTNRYGKEAWGGAETLQGGNLDLDEQALFVRMGEAFADPGVSGVLDSAANPVLPKNIKRSVQVDLLTTAATTQLGRFRSTQKATLNLGTAEDLMVDTIDRSTNATPNPVDWWKNDGGDRIAIRPGVYDLSYGYTDYDGKTEKAFSRKLIILPAMGDVNADGKVDQKAPNTDEGYLQNRIGDPLGYALPAADYPAAMLFRYRICDVNNDGNMNNIDGNKLHQGGAITQFYLPTNYK